MASASKIVGAAISSVPSLPECIVDTARTRTVKDGAQVILTAIAKENNLGTFESFAENLLSKIKALVTTARADSTASTCSLSREKMWTEFHELRATSLVSMWQKFLADIGCKRLKDPLLSQLVNQVLFEDYVKEYFTAPQSQEAAKAPSEKSLSLDE